MLPDFINETAFSLFILRRLFVCVGLLCARFVPVMILQTAFPLLTTNITESDVFRRNPSYFLNDAQERIRLIADMEIEIEILIPAPHKNRCPNMRLPFINSLM